MIERAEIDAILRELLDPESRKEWDLYAVLFAEWALRLRTPYGTPLLEFDLVRIESARAAKAKGIPLWRWKESYQAKANG